MNMILQEQIKFEEGFRSRMYRCTKGKRTIGYGHNLDANPMFNGKRIPHLISEAFAYELLVHDIEKTERELTLAWPYFENLKGARRDAIINMAFQMGVRGVLAFRRMIAAIEAKKWKEAEKEALDSKWAKMDTPNRAKRVATQLRSNKHYSIPTL